MRIPDRRIERRTPAAISVTLQRAAPGAAVLGQTENISAHGARVLANRRCAPDEEVMVTSLDGALCPRARVLYCQRLRDGKFAIGLRLRAPWDQLAALQEQAANPARQRPAPAPE